MRNTHIQSNQAIGIGVLVFLVTAVVFPMQELFILDRANLIHTTTLSLVTGVTVSLLALVALRNRVPVKRKNPRY